MSDADDRPAKRLRTDENVSFTASLLSQNETGLFALVRPSIGHRASTEPEVGITQYINPHVPAVSGILKHRFTDFLVFEVGNDGNVVRLKDIRGPVLARRQAQPEQQKPEPVQPVVQSALEWNDEKFSVVKHAFRNDDFEALKTFIEAGPSAKDSKPVKTHADMSKDERKQFHQNIRELTDGRLLTETFEDKESGEQRIVVKWNHHKSNHKRGAKGSGGGLRRANGPQDERQFIHFTMQKINRESHDALDGLKTMLHLQHRDVGVAGTKDKRGITTQRVSIKRGRKTVEDVWIAARGGFKAAQRVTADSKDLPSYDRNVRIGDVEYASSALELGMLQGNKFVVTLRDVQSNSLEAMNEAVGTIRKHGFINYYGMQRFGTAPVPTHVVGLALLRSDWQLATTLLLAPRAGEHQDAELARDKWQHGDLDGALKAMPRRAVAERAILESFKKQGTGDHLNALSKIPKNLRMMYVHAWQSYIWNRAVSERIKMLGPSAIVAGDLVFADADGSNSAAPPEQPIDTPVPTKIPAVHVVTQEEIDAGKYTVFDVVLPLPGFGVHYPEGKIGELYRRIMSDDKVDIDNMFRKQKEYSLGGAYRKMLHLPKDVSWRFLRYSSPSQDLAQSDEDRLLGKAPLEVIEHNPLTPLEAGESLALQIELTLVSSTYATMALREVLKDYTSSAHMKDMTVKMEQTFSVANANHPFDSQESAQPEALEAARE